MTSKIPLSEKRKELKRKIFEQAKGYFYWEDIFKVIEQQDAEAVKELKNKRFTSKCGWDVVQWEDVKEVFGSFNQSPHSKEKPNSSMSGEIGTSANEDKPEETHGHLKERVSSPLALSNFCANCGEEKGNHLREDLICPAFNGRKFKPKKEKRMQLVEKTEILPRMPFTIYKGDKEKFKPKKEKRK